LKQALDTNEGCVDVIESLERLSMRRNPKRSDVPIEQPAALHAHSA
jgi:hypothetical protein